MSIVCATNGYVDTYTIIYDAHTSSLLQALIYRLVGPILVKNAWQGAQTNIYCAVSEEMEGVSGQYLADCYIQRLKNPIALDDDVAERLWQVSCQMVGL